MTISQYLYADAGKEDYRMVNLHWRIKDDVQHFTVPDELLDFDRTKRASGADFDEAYFTIATDLEGNTNIVVNNKTGTPLYRLNGFVMTHDHFNYWDVDILTDQPLIGLADQVSNKLSLEDGVYSLWTRDVPDPIADKKLPGKNMYGVQPFVVSWSPKIDSVGFFSNNAAAQDWWIKNDSGNKKTNIKMFAAGGIGDHFIFVSNSSGDAQHTNGQGGPKDVVKQFNYFFGKPLAPPQWALGWHQCRWGYNSTDKLRAVISMYEQEELPLDSIWNDIDYMKDYRDFTIAESNGFGDLPALVDEIHTKNLHYVPIIDAGIALRPYDEDEYLPYLLSDAFGVLVKAWNNADNFVGMVWPNDAVYLDWFSKEAAHFWRGYLESLHEMVAFDGVWLDMNEASNFCHGACYQDQVAPFQLQDTLKYIPTGRDLSTQSISLEAVHANSFTEMDTHSLFGHMSAQATATWFELN